MPSSAHALPWLVALTWHHVIARTPLGQEQCTNAPTRLGASSEICAFRWPLESSRKGCPVDALATAVWQTKDSEMDLSYSISGVASLHNGVRCYSFRSTAVYNCTEKGSPAKNPRKTIQDPSTRPGGNQIKIKLISNANSICTNYMNIKLS